MTQTKPKPDNSGEVPMHILNQINEHAVGGFILFYFNAESGEPEQSMTFDSPAHYLALQKHISDWQKAIEEVTLDNSISNIQRNFEEESDENNESGEDLN